MIKKTSTITFNKPITYIFSSCSTAPAIVATGDGQMHWSAGNAFGVCTLL